MTKWEKWHNIPLLSLHKQTKQKSNLILKGNKQQEDFDVFGGNKPTSICDESECVI